MSGPQLDRLSMLVVRAASLMVPRAERREWVAEWTGELWQVQKAGLRQADTIGFSQGAVRDAFLIRWSRCRGWVQAGFARDSAVGCIMSLGTIALSGVLACFAIPAARATFMPLPYRQPGNLLMISRFNAVGREIPSIRLSEYREWTANTASLYQQLAFYAPEDATLRLRHRPAARLTVAIASANLLEVLQPDKPGVALRLRTGTGGPLLVLTQSAWARWYRSDPGLPGSTAQLRGQQVTIAGVIPDGNWRLPGHADAVLLEDSPGSEQLPATMKGFVVARIYSSASRALRGELHSMVETRDGVVYHYACMSLTDMRSAPAEAFACCVVLALLALPVITALSLGDYPVAREALRPRLVVRRCLFVTAKFVLVATIFAAWSAAIAFGTGPNDLLSAISYQVLIAFIPLLFGFRWVLHDQRRRCPVCMRRLSHPARVGQASWSFLGWCGTEMMCSRGHGLMHIPELPTSWFGAQRWLGLDPSWIVLFEDGSTTR